MGALNGSILDLFGYIFNNFKFFHRENYRRAVAANPKHRPFFDNNPYPASLPPDSMTHYPTPYKSIYQGSRKPGDTRVYNYKFDYEPKIIGHQISANGLFNCLVSYFLFDYGRYKYIGIIVMHKLLQRNIPLFPYE